MSAHVLPPTVPNVHVSFIEILNASVNGCTLDLYVPVLAEMKSTDQTVFLNSTQRTNSTNPVVKFLELRFTVSEYFFDRDGKKYTLYLK